MFLCIEWRSSRPRTPSLREVPNSTRLFALRCLIPGDGQYGSVYVLLKSTVSSLTLTSQVPPDLLSKDVSNDVNKTTLGPYSFLVFVEADWTSKTLREMQNLPATRRYATKQGRSTRKRPLAESIRSREKPRKRFKMVGQDSNTRIEDLQDSDSDSDKEN